jgi:hypothetical protein
VEKNMNMNMSKANFPVPVFGIEGAPATGNLAAGLFGGLMAAAVSAVVWAVITVETRLQISFIAIGVGFLVAYSVRSAGGGHSSAFAQIGGVCALLACLMGNLLSASAIAAQDQGHSVVSVFIQALAAPDQAVRLMQMTFNPMDLVFYALAVYEAYKLSRKPVW